jgi:hypothetical protein
MAVTSKNIVRTGLGTMSSTLYTTPMATKTTITNISISNNNSSASTIILAINGYNLLPNVSIAANTLLSIDTKIVMDAYEALTGYASQSSCYIHVSGVEIV